MVIVVSAKKIGLVTPEQDDLAVAATERPGADPHDLTGRQQVVEQPG